MDQYIRKFSLHWYSPKRGFHVYLLLSNFSNFTPNTWYTKYKFLKCFFSKIRRKEKRVFGVEQSLPIKLRVIGVFGKSKSCLGLGYTEACGIIRCHLKIFCCFLLEHFPSFFLSANRKHWKMFQVTYNVTHTFQCNQALTGNP